MLFPFQYGAIYIIAPIAEKNDVILIDVTKNPINDLSEYDCVGFASGIYYSKFQKKLPEYAENYMPEGKQTFFIYTYGAEKKGYTKAIAEAVKKHNAKILGKFGCYGFNTFGPFKLIGGIAKGHPDKADIDNALSFYRGL